MTDPCQNCANNQDGTINVRHCVETLCEVANSGAFKQIVRENEALKEQARIVDEEWKKEVVNRACELVALLR